MQVEKKIANSLCLYVVTLTIWNLPEHYTNREGIEIIFLLLNHIKRVKAWSTKRCRIKTRESVFIYLGIKMGFNTVEGFSLFALYWVLFTKFSTTWFKIRHFGHLDFGSFVARPKMYWLFGPKELFLFRKDYDSCRNTSNPCSCSREIINKTSAAIKKCNKDCKYNFYLLTLKIVCNSSNL